MFCQVVGHNVDRQNAKFFSLRKINFFTFIFLSYRENSSRIGENSLGRIGENSLLCIPFCQALGFFAEGQIDVGTPKNIQGLDILFLGLVDPRWNRLASTAYFGIVSSVFCVHGELSHGKKSSHGFARLSVNYPELLVTA